MNLTIYNSNGVAVVTIAASDDSVRYKALCGDDYVQLKWESADYVNIEQFSYVEIDGARYTLLEPVAITCEHSRKYKCEARFESMVTMLSLYRFRNPVDKRLKFSLTAKPAEHLQMLIDNLAPRNSMWSAGECVDGYEKTITYDYLTCREALELMAQTFDTEWEVVNGVISLHKVSYDKDTPIALSYGKGNGFVSGVARKNFTRDYALDGVFPQGSERNIDASKYGNPTLLLPKVQTIRYDGMYFEGDLLFDDTLGKSYITSGEGTLVTSIDTFLAKPMAEWSEGTLDCTEIYPHREGTVTDFILRGSPDKEYNYYDIVDDTIPASLDYEECRIGGENMVLVFQSGKLAGKEFSVSKYVHTSLNEEYPSRRFELISQEYDGVMMPNVDFTPAVGDKYAIFGIALPEAYVCDNTTKSGASWDMLRKCVRHLYDNERPQYTFSGKLDKIYVRDNALTTRLKPGAWVAFTNAAYQPEPMLVRIVSVKANLNDPNNVEIDISEKPLSPSTRIQQLKSNAKLNTSIAEAEKRAERDNFVIKAMTTGTGNDSLERKLGILIGDDYGKSVRKIATEVAGNGGSSALPVISSSSVLPASHTINPNAVYEWTSPLDGGRHFMLFTRVLESPTEEVWVLRFSIGTAGDYIVQSGDGYPIKWANGEAPTFEVGKYYELSFRLINTTFLGVWSSFS